MGVRTPTIRNSRPHLKPISRRSVVASRRRPASSAGVTASSARPSCRGSMSRAQLSRIASASAQPSQLWRRAATTGVSLAGPSAPSGDGGAPDRVARPRPPVDRGAMACLSAAPSFSLFILARPRGAEFCQPSAPRPGRSSRWWNAVGRRPGRSPRHGPLVAPVPCAPSTVPLERPQRSFRWQRGGEVMVVRGRRVAAGRRRGGVGGMVLGRCPVPCAC